MPTVITTQPVPLLSDNGVILSVGVVVNGDRTEMVIPCATDGAIDPIIGAAKAIEGFITGGLRTELKGLISSDAYISFIQAVGMVHGAVLPSRVDYAAADHPGTRGADPLMSREGAIGLFYGDPAQPSPQHRVRVAKQFVCGIAKGDLAGDVIVTVLRDLLETWCQHLADGSILASGGPAFYRVSAAVATAATTLCNVKLVNARNYTGTIRRRTLPH